MRLDINSGNLARQTGVRRQIEADLARHLAPYAPRIGTVRIRLRERASSESPRILCGIGVTLEPPDAAAPAWVLARAEDDDACRAVRRAVERVAKAIGAEIARRDRERAVRARALLALLPNGALERV